MTTITIRALYPSDFQAYRALRLAGMLETPHAFATSRALESAVPLAQIALRLKHSRFQRIFGAFDGELLSGIAGLRSEPIAVLHDKASVWGVYVAKAARRQGLARALMAAVIEHARSLPELRRLNLSIDDGNDAALALYLELGFTLQQRIDGESRRRMSLMLDDGSESKNSGWAK